MVKPLPVPAALGTAPSEGESLLTFVVHGHHEVDVALEEFLHFALPKAEKLELRRVTFLLKADILLALGVIPSEMRILYEQCNSARNKLAHNPHYEFSPKELMVAKTAVKQALPRLREADFEASENALHVYYWLMLSAWLATEHFQRAAIRRMAESAAVNERLSEAVQKIPPERRALPVDPSLEARVEEIADFIRKERKRPSRLLKFARKNS